MEVSVVDAALASGEVAQESQSAALFLSDFALQKATQSRRACRAHSVGPGRAARRTLTGGGWRISRHSSGRWEDDAASHHVKFEATGHACEEARSDQMQAYSAALVGALTLALSTVLRSSSPINRAVALHHGAWAKVGASARENASSPSQHRRRSRSHLIFCNNHGAWLCRCALYDNGVPVTALRR